MIEGKPRGFIDRYIPLFSRRKEAHQPGDLFPISQEVVLEVEDYIQNAQPEAIIADMQKTMTRRSHANVWNAIDFRANIHLGMSFPSAAANPKQAEKAYLLGASIMLHALDLEARNQGTRLPRVSDEDAFNIPVFIGEAEGIFDEENKENRYEEAIRKYIGFKVGDGMVNLFQNYTQEKESGLFIRMGGYEATLPY